MLAVYFKSTYITKVRPLIYKRAIDVRCFGITRRNRKGKIERYKCRLQKCAQIDIIFT